MGSIPVVQADDSFVSCTVDSVVAARYLCAAAFTWNTSYLCLASLVTIIGVVSMVLIFVSLRINSILVFHIHARSTTLTR